MSDINMTPLIDVMLVLLVIFMIAAPLMTAGLKLDLPKADAAAAAEPARFITVSLTKEGALYVGDEKLSPAALPARLAEAARQGPDTEVQLKSDRSVPYGRVAELIGELQKAGLGRIAFVTEPAASSP